jgi:hypothetical protein
MTHWLDRLAVRAGAAVSNTGSVPAAAARANPSAPEQTSHSRPHNGAFSRRTGLRAVVLATGMLVAPRLPIPGGSRASAATADCVPDCLAAAAESYRRESINCNGGFPEPVNFLATHALFSNPLCQAVEYERFILNKRHCVNLADCGRKQPPPPAPPRPTRGPPPPPPGGCGFVGLTSCGATCCPAGSLCGAAGCIPPPPVADCTPPCGPGKKCQGGQCVDVAADCAGVCPSGAKCCPSCGSGSFCWPADVPCRC